jgi:hypothetical protein
LPSGSRSTVKVTLSEVAWRSCQSTVSTSG